MSTPPKKDISLVQSSSQQQPRPAQVSDDERIAEMVWLRMQLEMNFNQSPCHPTPLSE